MSLLRYQQKYPTSDTLLCWESHCLLNFCLLHSSEEHRSVARKTRRQPWEGMTVTLMIWDVCQEGINKVLSNLEVPESLGKGVIAGGRVASVSQVRRAGGVAFEHKWPSFPPQGQQILILIANPDFRCIADLLVISLNGQEC